jgi:NADH-quinone oxidoreductase subunit N
MPGMTAAVPAFGPALPEILMAVGTLLLVLWGAIRGERTTGQVTIGALAILVLAAVMISGQGALKTTTFNGSFVVDPFARFMKLLHFSAGSAVALLMSSEYLVRERANRFEYPILVLLATLGMMMLISAGDLIALYLGLELMSLALYVVAAINRDDVRSTEAGLKYFVLGALSSGMLLYGAR